MDGYDLFRSGGLGGRGEVALYIRGHLDCLEMNNDGDRVEVL